MTNSILFDRVGKRQISASQAEGRDREKSGMEGALRSTARATEQLKEEWGRMCVCESARKGRGRIVCATKS